MKAKWTTRLNRHGLMIEEYDKAVFCNGTVFSWGKEYVTLSERSGCGSLIVPAGSYFREYGSGGCALRYQGSAFGYTFEEADRCVQWIRVIQMEPLLLECVEYRSIEAGDEPIIHTPEEDWIFSEGKDGICLEGYCGGRETILVPACLRDRPVKRLCLDQSSIDEACRELLISEGIVEVSLDLSRAKGLKRLAFPSSARFVSPPRGIDGTRWYKHQREAVYLGGCYCGTPGGGMGREDLCIKEGTDTVACGADFHCAWKRISMPESLRVIGDLAFADAPLLEEVQLPDCLEYIGNFAFQCCPRLEAVYLPDRISAPTAPFMLCDGLKEISMTAGCPIKTQFSPTANIVLRVPKSEG